MALITALIVILVAIIMAGGAVSATLMPSSHLLLGTLQPLGSLMIVLVIALTLAFFTADPVFCHHRKINVEEESVSAFTRHFHYQTVRSDRRESTRQSGGTAPESHPDGHY